MKVICPYCRTNAVLTDSKEVYGWSYGKIWICRPCQAWVGVHKGTVRPLGRLADAELRGWKKKAHSVFDPLWRKKIEREGCSKSFARKAGYRWLSEQLDIPFEKCHIGEFDVDMCQRVVEVCTRNG